MRNDEQMRALAEKMWKAQQEYFNACHENLKESGKTYVVEPDDDDCVDTIGFEVIVREDMTLYPVVIDFIRANTHGRAEVHLIKNNDKECDEWYWVDNYDYDAMENIFTQVNWDKEVEPEKVYAVLNDIKSFMKSNYEKDKRRTFLLFEKKADEFVGLVYDTERDVIMVSYDDKFGDNLAFLTYAYDISTLEKIKGELETAAWVNDDCTLIDNNEELAPQFEKVYQSVIDCDDLVRAFVNDNFADNETAGAKDFRKLADMAAQLHECAHELEERLAWD